MSETVKTSGATELDEPGRDDGAPRCTVVSLEKSSGPGGAEGSDWHRYIIDSPGSPIIGYRRGKKRDILAYLDECTSKLEERLVTRKKSARPASKKK
ncbi:MAG: hypothetical protein OEQ18_09195 [Gammaproteobacteria bacterium]|nr:hypothetical protein [Gammaproteobacteria bacterium]